jgi:dTDP-4-dehydrorhamnose reductase
MPRARAIEILILGGTGMLGHKLFQQIRQKVAETYCTIRGSIDHPLLRHVDLFHAGHVVENCDVEDQSTLEGLFADYRPRVVINCIGVIKQRPEAKQAIPTIIVNSLLPHRLAEICGRYGSRLIHFSTDCVFDGRRGCYQEEDPTDAQDLYGRTKALGEIKDGPVLTLRTSIIGRELVHSDSLLEWFLKQEDETVPGFRCALYSGLTTNRMADVVWTSIAKHPDLRGLYQVIGPTISKFDLLCLLRDAYRPEIEIVPVDEFVSNRSMRGDKFAKATGFVCPPWPQLVAELAGDITPYSGWRAATHEAI